MYYNEIGFDLPLLERVKFIAISCSKIPDEVKCICVSVSIAVYIIMI